MRALSAATRERRVLIGTIAMPIKNPRGGGYRRSPDSLIDAKRFGEGVLVDIAPPEYLAAVRFTLASSRLRLTAELPGGRVLGEHLLTESDLLSRMSGPIVRNISRGAL